MMVRHFLSSTEKKAWEADGPAHVDPATPTAYCRETSEATTDPKFGLNDITRPGTTESFTRFA